MSAKLIYAKMSDLSFCIKHLLFIHDNEDIILWILDFFLSFYGL